jgi:hypothetical protein
MDAPRGSDLPLNSDLDRLRPQLGPARLLVALWTDSELPGDPVGRIKLVKSKLILREESGRRRREGGPTTGLARTAVASDEAVGFKISSAGIASPRWRDSLARRARWSSSGDGIFGIVAVEIMDASSLMERAELPSVEIRADVVFWSSDSEMIGVPSVIWPGTCLSVVE